VHEGAQRYLRSLAESRCLPKISKGVSSIGYNKRRNRLGIDIDGLIGEWCVCAMLNARLDDSISLSGDCGWDTEVHGIKIDVKYNTYQNGWLYFMSPHDFKADKAVLVVPTDFKDTYRIAGSIDKQTFLDTHETTDWGYGKRYGLPQYRLNPITDLLEVVVNE
jgi:hypothetical protein